MAERICGFNTEEAIVVERANEPTDSQSKVQFALSRLALVPRRVGPGRGMGQHRLTELILQRLDAIFSNIQETHRFLASQGHLLINESGSLLAAQAHQNLDAMLEKLEDFLWILNCAIAKHGGTPHLV